MARLFETIPVDIGPEKGPRHHLYPRIVFGNQQTFTKPGMLLPVPKIDSIKLPISTTFPNFGPSHRPKLQICTISGQRQWCSKIQISDKNPNLPLLFVRKAPTSYYKISFTKILFVNHFDSVYLSQGHLSFLSLHSNLPACFPLTPFLSLPLTTIQNYI